MQKNRFIHPDDLKGLKIRVQQSPASVNMVKAFGAAASPMSFGEVYTAIQQGVIDGAENNELALTNNKHGEVAKYFSYDMHQTVPDMLIANRNFINGLSEDELEIFKEAQESPPWWSRKNGMPAFRRPKRSLRKRWAWNLSMWTLPGSVRR